MKEPKITTSELMAAIAEVQKMAMDDDVLPTRPLGFFTIGEYAEAQGKDVCSARHQLVRLHRQDKLTRVRAMCQTRGTNKQYVGVLYGVARAKSKR